MTPAELTEAMTRFELAIRAEATPWGVRHCRDTHWHVTHGDEDLALQGDPFKTMEAAYAAMEETREEMSPRAARSALLALYNRQREEIERLRKLGISEDLSEAIGTTGHIVERLTSDALSIADQLDASERNRAALSSQLERLKAEQIDDTKRINWIEETFLGTGETLSMGGSCYWSLEVQRGGYGKPKRIGEGDELRDAIDDAALRLRSLSDSGDTK